MSTFELPLQENEVSQEKGLTLAIPLNPQIMNDDEIEAWWQVCASQDYMFSDFERGNREGWIARFKDMRHLHLALGADGYCILLNAWCCDTPELHFCLWNTKRPVRDTVKVGEQILNFVFEEMHATRIGSFIPENHKNAIKLASMLGFKFEGCIRQGFRFHERSYDVHAYGLLASEWLARKGRLNAV